MEVEQMEKAGDFIKFALSHSNPDTVSKGDIPAFAVGDDKIWCYVLGTTGQVVTKNLLRRRWDEHYSRIASWVRFGEENFYALFDDYMGSRAVDCQGLLDVFLHTDVNADYCYREWCTEKGAIEDIDRPYVLGEAVFRKGSSGRMVHVGFICGFTEDGTPLTVEARSVMRGVGVWQLNERDFTHRGLVGKMLEYENGPDDRIHYELRTPMQRGEAFKIMQLALNAGGFRDYDGKLLTTDGKWGRRSQAAFEQMQKFNGCIGKIPEELPVTVELNNEKYEGSVKRRSNMQTDEEEKTE